jgi:hypothetical protein
VKLFLKSTILPCSGLLLLLALESEAFAAPINNGAGRNYAGKILPYPQGDVTGVKGTFSSGTNDLVNTVTPAPQSPTTSKAPFINKDVWLITTEPNPIYQCWIEAMVTKGNFVTNAYQTQTGPTQGTLAPGSTLSGNSFNGYWVATQRAYSTTAFIYTDYPYGVNNSSTAASGGSVEIVQGTGIGQWLVKINGTTALTLNGYACAKAVGFNPVVSSPSGASGIQIGLEANDDSPLITFTKGTKLTNLQVKQGTGSYVVLPGTNPTNVDLNNRNWTSTYSNGQLTINRP